VRHQPGELRSLMGLGLAELRADPTLAPALTGGARSLVLAGMSSMLFGRCDFDVVGRGRWLVLGIDDDEDFHLVASGDWTRDDVERGLMTGREGEPRRVAAPAAHGDLVAEPVTLVPLDGEDSRRFQPVGWIDERTFVTTTRADVDADEMMARVIGEPLERPSALDRQVAALDREATAWLAASREAFDDAVESDPLRGAALSARVALTSAGADFSVVMAYAEVASATTAHAFIEQQVETIAGKGLLEMALPGLVIARDERVVRIAGPIPTSLLVTLRDQVIQAMP
jgi:hypothetical protein